jgi:hypothetical protein
MGYLYYGTTAYAIEVDDRPLAHLKIALLTLLRAGHSVAFSFPRAASAGSGRETLWITPTTDIRFLFLGSRSPAINEAWVRNIMDTANQPGGLHLVPEAAGQRDVALLAS